MAWFRQHKDRTAYIFNPRLQVAEFLEYMMRDFGIPSGFENKTRMLMAINQWLLERYRNREHAVLIVDEAQNLSQRISKPFLKSCCRSFCAGSRNSNTNSTSPIYDSFDKELRCGAERVRLLEKKHISTFHADCTLLAETANRSFRLLQSTSCIAAREGFSGS